MKLKIVELQLLTLSQRPADKPRDVESTGWSEQLRKIVNTP